MIKAFLQRLLSVPRDAFRLWWLAPVIPLIAVIPEFVQHVVEIQIGMFESQEAAKALSDDPTRWAFGYAKLAGYLIAILAAARFWAAREQGLPWYSPKGIAWKVFGIGLLLNALLTLAIAVTEEPLKAAIGGTAFDLVSLVLNLVTLPLLVLLVAGLIGDRTATIRSVYRTGWAAAVRIVLFSAVVLIPLMGLHSLNHTLAFGAHPALVWALMVFDSLVVGLLAAGWGTAIHHGFRPLDHDMAAR